jgi:type I restriction enzyme, S subunit
MKEASPSKNLCVSASLREPKKEEAKPALVPKLRFPEFRGAKAWASEPMGEVYSFKGNNSLSRDKLNYVAGSVKNIHYGDIHTKFSSHFDITKELVPFINESELRIVREDNLCAEGDMIFADASEDMADIGKCIELVCLNGERLASGLHTILARRTGDRIALGFGGHLFKSGWVRTQIQKEAQGAKVLGISANRMRNLRLPLPHSKAEQQKIAECLSSVDELMAAQARKVDALKTHKKGLMQQLFPREGETQPRLRFPEFQNAGEWKRKLIGQLVSPALRPTDKPTTPYLGLGIRSHGKGTFLKIAENPEKNSMDTLYTVRPHDLIVNITFAWEGAVAIARECDDGALVSHRFPTYTANLGESIPGFLQYVILDKRFIYSLGIISPGGAGRNRVLSKSDFLKLPVLAPAVPEQQRIATCLSSLDALITAETQKHEALKTHKKGLMQQLFPSPEETNL